MHPIINPSALFMARNMTIYHQTRKASPERREARELTARVGKRQARYALKMMRHVLKLGASNIRCEIFGTFAHSSKRRALICATAPKQSGCSYWWYPATTPRHQVTLPPEMA